MQACPHIYYNFCRLHLEELSAYHVCQHFTFSLFLNEPYCFTYYSSLIKLLPLLHCSYHQGSSLSWALSTCYIINISSEITSQGITWPLATGPSLLWCLSAICPGMLIWHSVCYQKMTFVLSQVLKAIGGCFVWIFTVIIICPWFYFVSNPWLL